MFSTVVNRPGVAIAVTQAGSKLTHLLSDDLPSEYLTFSHTFTVGARKVVHKDRIFCLVPQKKCFPFGSISAQTKINFAAIKLFETKKENEFQQNKEGIRVNKTTVNRSIKQPRARQRRSSIVRDKYLAKYLAHIWQITKIFSGLPRYLADYHDICPQPDH